MRDERLKNLLGKLAEFTTEPVREDFDEDIRHQIPYRLVRHNVTWNTFRIMIDLRLSRSVAAAVIIISISVWASFLGAWNTSADQVIEDSKLLIKYGLAGKNTGRAEVLASLEDFCRHMSGRAKEVTYYGKSANPDDSYAVLMHWKLPDGKYRVVFNDLTTRTVSPEVLVTLQAYMLREHLEQ
jgi:hypothetical protein